MDTLSTTPMQDALGVAVRLLESLKDQIARGLERNAGIQIRRHRPIQRISGILRIHDIGHADQCFWAFSKYPGLSITRYGTKSATSIRRPPYSA